MPAPRRIPRGILNHNPLNLREAPGDKTIWLHERATDDDAEFEEFDIPEGGIRAACINFRTYKVKHGVTTVRQWITRWAPPNGRDSRGRAYSQDTEAYIRVVCNAVGVDHDEPVDLEDWDTVLKGLRAMIRHENGPAPSGWEGRTDGSWYADSVLIRGMEMARVKRPPAIEQVARSPTAQTAMASAAGGVTLGVTEMLSIADAGKGFADLDTMALVRIALVILVVVGSLYIINRRVKHAKG